MLLTGQLSGVDLVNLSKATASRQYLVLQGNTVVENKKKKVSLYQGVFQSKQMCLLYSVINKITCIRSLNLKYTKFEAFLFMKMQSLVSLPVSGGLKLYFNL